MTTARPLMLPTSEFFEKCARHTTKQTARELRTIFLCDDCNLRLVTEAFNNRPPVHEGRPLHGYCGLCNRGVDVRMRQWFICIGCWPVVTAYQKSLAASAAICSWWQNKIAPEFPNLLLEETEPVRLEPYARVAKTKLESAQTLEILDFLVSSHSNGTKTPLFHIEQKSGPGSIDQMSKFQLDVNDINDICGAANKTGLPTYVFHVQSGYDYSFPTRRVAPKAIWWTDVQQLLDHQLGQGSRADADKKAVFYSPDAFSPIETFIQELRAARYKKLRLRGGKTFKLIA